jgi:dTDP-4-dehydrorhamnose 3,5-epimerase
MVKLSKVKIINNNKGKIFKIFNKLFLKNKCELYCSEVYSNSIKAWKYHKKITNNFYVISGSIKFVILNKNKFLKFTIGNNQILTLPPGYWYGFKGLGKTKSLILNLINKKHNEKEMLRKKINEIQYNW